MPMRPAWRRRRRELIATSCAIRVVRVSKGSFRSEVLTLSRRIPDRRGCLGRNWGGPEHQLSESSDAWIVVACSAVGGWTGRPDCRSRLENGSMSPGLSST